MKKLAVIYHHDNSVAQIILFAPPGNVIDNIMMNELNTLFKSFMGNSKLKLITLEGFDKNFSFGASVEEHKKENAREMIATFHKTLITLSELHIPVLSKVSGLCLGGGMELVMMTHFIFADMSTVFAQPEINLSVFPPPASIMLPLKIGYGRSEEILLTGRNIPAKEAKMIGLVNYVSKDKEALHKDAEEWIAEHILPKSPAALRFATQAGRIRLNKILKEELITLEKLYLDELMESHDANEGINAFIEKRKPMWKK